MNDDSIPAQRALARDFFSRDTIQVARAMLGAVMMCRSGEQWIGGRVVETEAYLHQGDLARHSARGQRVSNAAMFDRPGTLYVYPIHAKYCFNIATEPVGYGAAVLVRAVEPLWGLPLMRIRRGCELTKRLTSGPAMLCQALGIDRRFNGVHVTEQTELVIARGARRSSERIACSPRIGVSKSEELLLRFFLAGNEFVSGPRRLNRTS